MVVTLFMVIWDVHFPVQYFKCSKIKAKPKANRQNKWKTVAITTQGRGCDVSGLPVCESSVKSLRARVSIRCTNARMHTHRHSNTRMRMHKQNTSLTYADSFPCGSLYSVPYALYHHAAEFLQWCVRKCTSSIRTSHEPCPIQSPQPSHCHHPLLHVPIFSIQSYRSAPNPSVLAAIQSCSQRSCWRMFPNRCTHTHTYTHTHNHTHTHTQKAII